MSNSSLQEQLQAVASQLSNKLIKTPAVPSASTVKPAAAAKSPKKETRKTDPSRPQVDKSKKPKPKWLDYVQYGVELLKAYYPETFKAPNAIQPLKKGIKQDLVKHLSTLQDLATEDKACMVKSLSFYVNTLAYHKSVLNGATRIDLEGKPAGEVTVEEASYSVERQQAKIQAKKSALTQTQPKHTEDTL